MGLGYENQTKSYLRPARTKVLAIAIDDYQNGWRSLNYPVSDCENLLGVLEDRYGISTPIENRLYNERATKKAILQKLRSLWKSSSPGDQEYENLKITPEENLILILSGHGFVDKENPGGRGYFVPNSKKEFVDDEEDLINPDHIVHHLSSIRAGHTLLIIDACYSTSFANREIELPPDISPDVSSKSTKNPSRWILTSGRNEMTPDKSLFAETLCEILKSNRKPSIGIARLSSELKTKLQNADQPIPHCVDLVGTKFKGGEFQFYLNETLQQQRGTPTSLDDQANLLKHLEQESNSYRKWLLKEGRFKHVRIEEILLAQASIHATLHTQVMKKEERFELLTSITSLWKKENCHAILLGSGGMGKTLSLLHIWEKFLEANNRPLPLFVALNEYNNAMESARPSFILGYIARHYLNEKSLTPETENLIWKLFTKEREKDQPGIVLLLDGFNEVTADRTYLTSELNSLSSEAKNVQLVVTSRFVEIQNFTWARGSEPLDLVPLEEDAILRYLQNLNVSLPQNPNQKEKLLKLFGNPMMLTLFAGTDRIATEYANDPRFSFFAVQTEAELIWNFHEAQLAKQSRDLEGNRKEQIYATFLIRYLVPLIAWRMEKEGVFFIGNDFAQNPRFNFNTVIGEACAKLRERGSLLQFPDIRKIADRISLQNLDDLADIDRSEEIKDYLSIHLNILVQEGSDLRFLHQNFRDFYAACHLRNCIRYGLAEGKRPKEWKERTLPVYLRRMIGELEGEYLFDPQELLQGKEIHPRIKQNLLTRLFDACRTQKMNDNFTVWNLVSILHEIRGKLAGADLKDLDLRGIVLNNIFLSAFRSKKYLPSKIEGAILNGKQFIFQGHVREIYFSIYSSDGKKVLSVSADDTIKEWSIATGESLNTFPDIKGVNSATYSQDNQKILISSKDLIFEYSISTFTCLTIFEGHTSSVLSARYNRKGDRVISFSSDETIKEWLVSTGECLNTFKGHTDEVRSAVYNEDGDRLLSTCRNAIKEWSISSGECLITLNENSGWLLSAIYSSDSDRIFTISYDGKLKEWSLSSKECLNTLQLNAREILFPVFSKDTQRILSSTIYGNIEEFSISTGEFLRDFILNEAIPENRELGFSEYSPDSHRILTSSREVIKEWSNANGECLNSIEIFPTVEFASKDFFKCHGYSPDGKRLLFTCRDGIIREWSLSTNKWLTTQKVSSVFAVMAFYRRDNNSILCPFAKIDNVKELDISTGECINSFEWISPVGKNDGYYIKNNKHYMATSEFEEMFYVSDIPTELPEKANYDPGLFVQAVDFRYLHPDSVFTEEEKERLRRYGAIFDDQDEKQWNQAVEDAYGE